MWWEGKARTPCDLHCANSDGATWAACRVNVSCLEPVFRLRSERGSVGAQARDCRDLRRRIPRLAGRHRVLALSSAFVLFRISPARARFDIIGSFGMEQDFQLRAAARCCACYLRRLLSERGMGAVWLRRGGALQDHSLSPGGRRRAAGAPCAARSRGATEPVRRAGARLTPARWMRSNGPTGWRIAGRSNLKPSPMADG